ncbi:hypothetical protein D3C84_126080 [compost metagenome]
MQGPLQIVGDRPWQFLRAIGKKADQGIEVGFRLVTENLQQLRIEGLAIEGLAVEHFDPFVERRDRLDFVRRRDNRGSGRHALAFRQRMRGGGQQVDIVTLTLGLGGEFIDQCRHQRDHIDDHLEHLGNGLDTAVEHPVEQVLDRPAKLTDHQRPHHAATALEGVEGPADFDQGLVAGRVGAPLRQKHADGFQDFAGFLDKHFHQLFVDRLLIGRRRQQAGRHIVSRRVDRLQWRGHDIGQRQRLVGSGLIDHWRRTRQLDLGHTQ